MWDLNNGVLRFDTLNFILLFIYLFTFSEQPNMLCMILIQSHEKFPLCFGLETPSLYQFLRPQTFPNSYNQTDSPNNFYPHDSTNLMETKTSVPV